VTGPGPTRELLRTGSALGSGALAWRLAPRVGMMVAQQKPKVGMPHRCPTGEERIALLGEAGDSIAASPADVPIPEWHVQEPERRLSTPDPQFVPWREVRSRVADASQLCPSASARTRPMTSR